MRKIYENVPFEASARLADHLSRTLGGSFQLRSDGARVVRVAGTSSLPDPRATEAPSLREWSLAGERLVEETLAWIRGHV